jgi:hypothetical protein
MNLVPDTAQLSQLMSQATAPAFVLVPTIAESRVMIRQGDEQTDSPGDGDRLDHRGA